MKIYCYAKGKQMIGHEFADDVAVVMAKDKGEAIKKFSTLYADPEEDCVSEISIDEEHPTILTDY